MKRGIFVLIVVICVTLAFVVQAFSMGQRPPIKKTEADEVLLISGKIAEFNHKKSILIVASYTGESVKFHLTDETTVTKAGRVISIAELKKGVQVTVYYHVNLDKKITHLITISEQPKVAPKTTPVKVKK